MGFIRQQGNAPVPDEVDDPDNAVLMVSKKVTSDDLPAGPTPFDGDPNLTDPDFLTYRIEVENLIIQSGQIVEFRVAVGGSGQGGPFTYGSVVDPTDGSQFRSDAYVRLVSNGRPATGAEPDPVSYDDEVQGDQTLLVRLGDTVTAEVLVDDEVVAETSLPVGRPPTEDGDYAIRTAHLRFHTQSGTSPPMNTAPQVMTERASEDWAQAGVRFSDIFEGTFTPKPNALIIDGAAASDGTATSSGYITLDVGCGGAVGRSDFVEQKVAAGQSEQEIAANLAQTIGALSTVSAEALRDDFFHSDNTSQWLVVVQCGSGGLGTVNFDNVSDGGIQNLDVDPFMYDPNGWSYSELNLVGYNYGDGQDDTIEVFAIPDSSLQSDDGEITYGLAGTDRTRDRTPGAQNALFITQSALDGIDEHNPPSGKIGYPFVLGHEIGHILFNNLFDGDDGAGHTTQCTNLMRNQCGLPPSEIYGTSRRESITASKRLTVEQHLDARVDSGPDTTPPILKRE